jgi:hypothetical protein
MVLVLGENADDKGAQFESLLVKLLQSEGVQYVRRNVVRAGGNEIDVAGELLVSTLGQSSGQPVLIEAKAYKDAVNMPTWQRFLGKLFIGRSDNPSTIGILVALNGVNGNVSGSFEALRLRDPHVRIIAGADLQRSLITSGEVADVDAARASATAALGASPIAIELTYYAGSLYWACMYDEDYVILDGFGQVLASDILTTLRAAAEATITGTMRLPNDLQLEAERIHSCRLQGLDALLRHGVVTFANAPQQYWADDATVAAFAGEPFCVVDDAGIRLIGATACDANSVSRFFEFIRSGPIKITDLNFVAQRLHQPYVERLVELLPEIQGGFAITAEDSETLRSWAPAFPSVWMLLASPIVGVASPDLTNDDVDEVVHATRRNMFWEAVLDAIHRDFASASLRGLLYDHLDIAEIELQRDFSLKSKGGLLGRISVETRTAIKRLVDGYVGPDGASYALVRMLPSTPEPWDEDHPQPTPLGL